MCVCVSFMLSSLKHKCLFVHMCVCMCVHMCVRETVSHINTTAPNSAHLFSSNKFNLTLPQQSMMFSGALGGAICDRAWHVFFGSAIPTTCLLRP